MLPVKKYFITFKENPVWVKVFAFTLILFFVRLADAIIAFWAPNQIQNSLNNPIIMGAVISVQSLVGFSADLIFPRLLKSVRIRKLVFWAILTSALTSFFLTTGYFVPLIAIFIVTMVLWGIYYELVSFANYQFMGSVVPLHMRTAAWGFTGIFLNLAYFLGPFIAAQLLLHGVFLTQGSIIIFLTTALILLTLSKKMHGTTIPTEVDFSELNPWLEFKHWLTLSRHIWPVLIISFVLGVIDSTFWTVGAVWTEKLIHINSWGIWFLPLYLLPDICLGIPLSGWNIYQGKKKLAEIFLGISGILLAGIGLFTNIPWQLAVVGLASSALAVCYPLIQAIYSDIIARMGQDKKDMIGLTSSVANVSYIVWPVFAGIIASQVGERLTFSWLGVGVLIVAVLLLLITPKKLHLPQEEIKTWH